MKLKQMLSETNAKHVAFMRDGDIVYHDIPLLEALMYTGVMILNSVYLSEIDLSEFEQ